MKNYPRIYSLSTLGLIHHYENDYLFHNMRTDFVGDSGSGKSIIADLLQLIFVGSEMFESATRTMDEKRELDGLVLRTPHKGIDIGYAFLNIEIQSRHYIVIGCYLESNSKRTKPFIIQGSSDPKANLLPIGQPLQTKDFKREGNICPLDDLLSQMEEKGLFLSYWETVKPYHRILYTHDILPLDLASNEKTLKDYASVIRSFSRGKTIDTSNSNNLKQFIFGTEKIKENRKKYEDALKDFTDTIFNYNQNLNTIKILTDKEKALSTLYGHLKNRQITEQEYRQEEILDLRQQTSQLSKQLHDNLTHYLTARQNFGKLMEQADKDIAKAREEEPLIEQQTKRALEDYTLQSYENKILEKAITLQKQTGLTDLRELTRFYTQYQQSWKRHTLLTTFEKELQQKDLLDSFLHSEWTKGYEAGLQAFLQHTEALRNELEIGQSLQQFSDLDNPDSLARWALSLHRPLNRAEESLIIHFQDLKRHKPISPKARNRYLPHPEELFNHPTLEQEEHGFWINLQGVREFVSYSSHPVFNTDDQSRIEDYFRQYSTDLKKRMERITQELRQQMRLKEHLSSLSNLNEILTLYQSAEPQNEFREIPALHILQNEFDHYIRNLQRQSSIEKEYQQACRLYKDYESRQTEIKTLLNKLAPKVERFREELKNSESSTNLPPIARKLSATASPEEYELSFYLDADDKNECFQDEYNLTFRENLLLYPRILTDWESLQRIEEELKVKQNAYPADFPPLPDWDISRTAPARTAEKKEAFHKADTVYITQFDFIVDTYLSSQSYKFQTFRDFRELSMNLLPEIFQGEEPLENEVIEAIEKQLKRINDKNRELNDKKIEKISRILEDVWNQISQQRELVRRINRFFHSGEKTITGNNRLNLECTNSSLFPPEWLNKFQDSTGTQFDLFNPSIKDKLVDDISIGEKLIHAFQELTHSKKEKVRIDDLLNPNNYLELKLIMHNDKGKSNKGSTGQTYAAIALLCIARLTIIGNQKQGKANTGLRFMPIDEAEGLGTNFDLLYDIAQEFDYQIISFSINPIGRYQENERFIYILHENPDTDDEVNYSPMAIFSREDIQEDLITWFDAYE